MEQLTGHEGSHCANCGAPMHGEFCHACGQSIRSVLKPVHGLFEETVETVLGLDSRLVHTLPPLLLKPGFLTLEYFSGRRMRYVAPFRLMFTLCLLSFFVFHLAIDQISARAASYKGPAVTVTGATFKDADTPKEVRKVLKRQLATLPQISAFGVLPQNQLDMAAEDMRQQANRRLLELGAAPMPAASFAAPLAIAAKEADPVRIAWLPDAVNAGLTTLGQQMHNNWRTFKDGSPAASSEAKQRMINGVFGVLPATMFVLIPAFAGLLKLFYLFRRRLYMEHLIVGLHSHAFMFLGLLLITVTGMLSTWLRPQAAWTGYALGWIQALLILWIPTYLLIMQKRVYRQGWPMTLLKFWITGWCYFWLLMVALTVAALLGLAN